MKPALKRKLLRPLTWCRRTRNKIFHELRTPEEIIDLRNKLHDKLIMAERIGNEDNIIEYTIKKETLNWVLKEDDSI
jgi:hypothetical protein